MCSVGYRGLNLVAIEVVHIQCRLRVEQAGGVVHADVAQTDEPDASKRPILRALRASCVRRLAWVDRH